MTDAGAQDVTRRFDGLADLYSQYRPTYPAAAIAHIVRRAGLTRASVVADVGCGTGISSRLFAQLGMKVIGIEPNESMRQVAEETDPDQPGRPEYRVGRAEETGLPDGSCNLVLAAQAFHWFDAPATLAEFRRILKPGGLAALVWNERDERDPFSQEYGAIIRSREQARVQEEARQRAGQSFLVSTLFDRLLDARFVHRQPLSRDGVIGRAMSVSYAPKDAGGKEEWVRALGALYDRYEQDGVVYLRYITQVLTGRRVG